MTDLSTINIGDMVAAPARNHWTIHKNRPTLTHDVFRVTARTATQIKAIKGSEEFRIRISDGMFIGDSARRFQRATPATPEILAQHQAQWDAMKRFDRAAVSLRELMGKELHQLNLTTEQMEHLGKAWAEVQAMGQQDQGSAKA